MAEMIITVSPRATSWQSEGLTRAQWEQATAGVRAVLGGTRQAIESEQHVHHTEVHGRSASRVTRGAPTPDRD
jgi:hypothetical protein